MNKLTIQFSKFQCIVNITCFKSGMNKTFSNIYLISEDYNFKLKITLEDSELSFNIIDYYKQYIHIKTNQLHIFEKRK